MADASFLGLERDGQADRWALPATLDLAGGAGQLFGGCALGAGALILEELSGKPTVWATGQFLSMAIPPDVLTFDAELVSSGRNFAQGRIVARVDGREVVTVLGAAGSRAFDSAGRWAAMPEVPPPEECPTRSLFGSSPGRLHHRLEQRIVTDTDSGEHFSPTGRVRVWMRLPDASIGSTIGLAIAADFLPLGIRAALGRDTFGASLDNTVRYLRRCDDEWVLADIAIDEVADGVGHGSVSVWSPAGDLLAIGSQTCAIRDTD